MYSVSICWHVQEDFAHVLQYEHKADGELTSSQIYLMETRPDINSETDLCRGCFTADTSILRGELASVLTQAIEVRRV